MQCTPDDIRSQLELLKLHRENAQYYRVQALAYGHVTLAPVITQRGLRDAYAGIATCKAILRSWAIHFPDEPGDEEPDQNPSGQPAATEADILGTYRREVAARYAHWRNRYAPVRLLADVDSSSIEDIGFEPEDYFFQASYQSSTHTIDFTDMREGLRQCGDMVLLGPPGVGKTTALWRLALDLAEDGLKHNPQAPLPIVIRLSSLRQGQDLLTYAQLALEQETLKDTQQRPVIFPAHRALAPLLPQLLQEGRLVLLWDGLNETPPAIFAYTAQQIIQLYHQYPRSLVGPNNHHVITCRADDYERLITEHKIDLPLTPAIIQPLDNAMVRQIILRRLGNQHGQQLLEALAEPQHRHLADLVRTPLLLMLLCKVYKKNNALPATRGQLLGQFVLERIDWEKSWHHDPADRAITAIRFNENDLIRPLARLAYAMTKSHKRGTSVRWPWARQKLAGSDINLEPEQIRTLASSADLLEPLAEGGELRFTHQLIQEYFAAVALHDELERLEQRRKPTARQHSLAHMARYAAPGRRTGWEETLLLLAGIDGEGSLAHTLVRGFLSYPLEAARLLLASGDPDPALLDEVRALALAQIRDPHEPVQTRFAAGRALGLLGDPRFPVTPEQWGKALEQARAGETGAYFCRVEAGSYLAGPDEQPRRRNTFAQAFWIARLPITNAQWQAWPEAQGDAAHVASNQSEPNRPLINASWEQAQAFCRWLSGQLGLALRLPTEDEWEAAAAGREGWRYPWGNSWLPDRAATLENSDTRGHKGSMPAGCYPAGASPCGALDMAGNVWEWTVGSGALPAPEWPVLRGGNFGSPKSDARCAARSPALHPDDELYAGFRVVIALAPGA